MNENQAKPKLPVLTSTGRTVRARFVETNQTLEINSDKGFLGTYCLEGGYLKPVPTLKLKEIEDIILAVKEFQKLEKIHGKDTIAYVCIMISDLFDNGAIYIRARNTNTKT